MAFLNQMSEKTSIGKERADDSRMLEEEKKKICHFAVAVAVGKLEKSEQVEIETGC